VEVGRGGAGGWRKSTGAVMMKEIIFADFLVRKNAFCFAVFALVASNFALQHLPSLQYMFCI
jgi:hypothetical protein